MSKKDKKFINRYLIDIIIALSLLMFAFFINEKIRISGLYMDDLYMWSCYNDLSFKDFILPTMSTRFRPVYWFVAWLELGLIKSNIGKIVPINIVFAAIIAIIIYLFTKKLSKNRVIACITSFFFLVSRFSYYNISQLLGLMEAMGVLFFVIQIYYVYKFFYFEEKDAFYKALLFYLFASLTHERYMVIVPIFYISLIFVKSREIDKYLAPILTFIMLQFARFIMIGTVLPAGTGGTNVADTFSIKSFVVSAIKEVLYIFGINKGPEHLCGIMWSQYPLFIKVCSYIAIIISIIIFALFVFSLVLKKNKNISINKNICFFVILLSFIGASIVSSSVTIRVEMRWIYAPLCACLILLSYMIGVINEGFKFLIKQYEDSNLLFFVKYIHIILAIILILVLIPADLITRKNYDKIYLFPKQKIYNSLADLTVGKYGNDVFGSDILVVGRQYQMSDFDAKEFFKVYNKYNHKEHINIYYYDSIYELPKLSKKDIVLKEESKYSTYTDITSVIHEMQIGIVEGYYESDGWMNQNAELNILTGKDGKIRFDFLYPGEVGNNKVIKIKYDNDKEIEYKLEKSQSYLEFEFEPYRRINFKFNNNFINDEITDERDGHRLSVIVNISVS